MQQKHLARALGISPAMVSKLAKRGMPTDSLDSAQRWRRRHLEPARMKGSRVESVNAQVPRPQASGQRIASTAEMSSDYVEATKRPSAEAVALFLQLEDETRGFTLDFGHAQLPLVNRLGELAHDEYGRLEQPFRWVMGLVPTGLRELVVLPCGLWFRLCAYALPAIRARAARLDAAAGRAVSSAEWVPPEMYSDPISVGDGAVGAFWYRVACGELDVAATEARLCN